MMEEPKYYPGTTTPVRKSKYCVDALWRLALKDCAKEYWLGVRRMAEQVLKELEVLEILREHLRFMNDNHTAIHLVNNGCAGEYSKLRKVKEWMEDYEKFRDS